VLTRRVAVAALVGSLFTWAAHGTAFAQDPGGSGAFGEDQQAGGELLGDDSADVWAEDGSDLGPVDQPSGGGGDVVCRWFGMDPETENPAGPIDWEYMRNPPAHLIGVEVSILKSCVNSQGNYLGAEIVTLTLPTGEPPVVDPRDLAMMARSRLPLPLPAARMSPDGEQTVNLETWLWVDNWQTQTRSATAGGVTSVVVATPVEQRWTFGSPSEREVCGDAGAPYDLSKQPSEQSTECSYTFRHSSAGQPGDAYRVTVTLVWHVTWTSNIGASGDLGFVSRTTTIPTRVAEHQALNESGSGR
jgi:hypothetical protein